MMSPTGRSQHSSVQQYTTGGYGARQAYGSSSSNAPITIMDCIKAGQRASTEFKDAWHGFCEKNGSQTYDPNKHSQDFCAGFFVQCGQLWLQYGGMMPNVPDNVDNGDGQWGNGYAAGWNNQGYGKGGYGSKGVQGSYGKQGATSSFKGNPAPVQGVPQPASAVPAVEPHRDRAKLNDLVSLITAGNESDESWKSSWVEWCKLNGAGVEDPNRHVQNPMFVIAFAFKWGLASVCETEWAKPFLVSLGDVSKPFMVATVKKGQSCDPSWKEAWGKYADGKLNYRDPTLHDPGSLLEFFDTIAIKDFANEPYMKPFFDGTEV